jgi:hypothetical protein
MTILGIIFVPLALWAAVFRPRWLLPLLIVSSAFQASAVMNVGAGGGSYIGLMPYYFVALVICVRLFWDWAVGRGGPVSHNCVGIFLGSFAAFVFVAVLGAFVLPVLFQGAIVDVPREGIGELGPLRPTFSNWGQAGYLGMNFLLVVYALRTTRRWAQVGDTAKAMHLAAGLVVGLGIYQLISLFYGLPYPHTVINSNFGAYQGYMQTVLGQVRMSSTFSEPSDFAAFLVSYLGFCVVLVARRGARLWATLWIGIVALCLVLSTATTAYAAAGVLLVLFILFALFSRVRAERAEARRYAACLVLGVVLAGAAALLGAWFSGTGRRLRDVLETATVLKSESLSYQDRLASDRRAVGILSDTGGLGVGLGSNRPSSFLTWLLSNAGVVGSGLFILAFASLLRRARWWASASVLSERKRALISAAMWALAIHLVAKAISQPDLAFPTLWVWVIMLVVSMRVAWLDVQSGAARAPLSKSFLGNCRKAEQHS